MRKKSISPVPQLNVSSEQNWLDLEKLEAVEITSEEDRYPIESALLPGRDSGWRASGPETDD